MHGSSQRPKPAAVVLKDSYGFVVKRDYHDLFNQYAPIWVKEELERGNLWSSFLLSFAPDAIREEAAKVAVQGRLETACEAGLQPFRTALAEWRSTEKDGAECPPWVPQLRSLVQAGVPRALRGKLWQSFLNTDSKREAGAYDALVQKALGGTKYGRRRTSSQSQVPVTEGPGSTLSRSSSNASASVPSAAPAATLSAPNGIPSHDGHATDAAGTSWDAAPPNAAEGSDGPSNAAVPQPLSDTQAARSASSEVPAVGTHKHKGSKSGRLSASGSETGRRSRSSQGWHASTNDWNVQIEKDLHRTFPGHPIMDRRGRCALRRILAAYSRRNDSVGYCQGMNFVAGAMLLFMNEEDAFWCLCAIVEDLLPGYFALDLIAPQVDQLVFKHLVDQRFPTLCSHLTRQGVNVSSMALNWFLTMFVTSLPLESTLRVWDVLFFDCCSSVLFRCSLALVDIYAQALVATVDSIDAFSLLHAMAPMSFDASRLIDMACIAFASLTMDQIQSLRTAYRTTIIASKRDNGSSEDDEAAWASSDEEGRSATEDATSPAALAGGGGSGDYYSGSDDSVQSADEATGEPAPLRRDASLEEVRKYVSTIPSNELLAGSSGADTCTPVAANSRAAGHPELSPVGEVPSSQEKPSPASRQDKAQQLRPGQPSSGDPPEGAGTGSRDGGLHAAMGAASAVSKQLKNFATGQGGPEGPQPTRRLFGRSRRRSSKGPVSGAAVLGAPTEDELAAKLAISRSSAAAEAAYHIAATPFKTPPRGGLVPGSTPFSTGDDPTASDAAVVPGNTSPSVTAAVLAGTDTSSRTSAAGAQSPPAASAAERARKHIQDASSVVARTITDTLAGRKAAEEAAEAEDHTRHAAAMAKVLAMVEGLEEELHAAEAACHEAEVEAHTSCRHAKDARVELDSAIVELQEKAKLVDRLHDKLLGVNNTLAFFDAELESKERALATVRAQIAERDQQIAHKDALIAQLMAAADREAAAANTRAAAGGGAPTPLVQPSSGSFFRKLRSSVVGSPGASLSEGSTLSPAASGGSQTGARWGLRGAGSGDAPPIDGMAAPAPPSEGAAAAPSHPAADVPAEEVAFVPKNLDDELPNKPQMQPLIVSNADLAADKPVK